MSLMQALEYKPNNHNDRMSLIIDILSLYNLRISEILSLKWSDVKQGSYIYVRGKKNSRDTIIRDRQIVSAINQLHHINSIYIFAPITYANVYRHIKRYLSHLFDRKYNKKNSKVTHYFRYKNAESLTTEKEVSTLLNHSGYNSAKYYNKHLKGG